MRDSVVILGVSHRTAEASVRDALARASQRQDLHAWKNALPEGSGVVLLSTCNRVEWVISLPTSKERSAFSSLKNQIALFLKNWCEWSGLSYEEFESVTYFLEGSAAIEHLFRVAASLESLVPGEPQILGQLKAAYQASEKEGLAMSALKRTFNGAFRVAKKVRRETHIGTGSLSVASLAARELLERLKSQNLTAPKVLVIGTGKTARLFIQHFQKESKRIVFRESPEILITGRTPEKVALLAEEFSATFVIWEDRYQAILKADGVIGAVSVDEPVILSDKLQEVRREVKSQYLLDLSLPKSIDSLCHQLEGVRVLDVDSLRFQVEKNFGSRREGLEDAEEIIALGIQYHIKKHRDRPRALQEAAQVEESCSFYCSSEEDTHDLESHRFQVASSL